MSSLDRAMDRKMASVTQQLVELLHDSPLPSLDDIREDLAVIKSFVKDIKSEVKNLETNCPNSNNLPDTEESNESSGDDSSRGTKDGPGQVSRYLRDRIADWLEENWRHRIHPMVPEGNEFDRLIDLLRGDGRLSFGDVAAIISLFYFDRYMDPFDMLDQARDMLPQMQLMRADVSPRGPLALTIRQFSETTNDLIDALSLLTVETADGIHSRLSEQISDNAGNIIAGIASLRSLNDAYLPTIYDKIVECCVVNDVQEVLTLLTSQSDSVSEILSILRSGGSPALLSQNGAILSGLKSIQAELSAIRGLL